MLWTWRWTLAIPRDTDIDAVLGFMSIHSSCERLAMPKLRLRCWKFALLFWFEALVTFSYQGPFLIQGCRVHAGVVGGGGDHSCASHSRILSRSVSVAPEWRAEDSAHVSDVYPVDQEQKERHKEERRRQTEKRRQRKMERQRRKEERNSRPLYPVPSAQPSSSPLHAVPHPGLVPPRTSPSPVSPALGSPPKAGLLQPPASGGLAPRQSSAPRAAAPASSPHSSLPSNASCGICGESYAGQVGDTLLAVSKICSVDPDSLLEANPQIGRVTDGVAGRRVTVPCTATDPAGCDRCGASYYVQNGETLIDIAAFCGVSLEALEDANSDLLSFDSISIDQYLTVPCRQPVEPARVTEGCGVCGLFHTVIANDTIGSVAQACGVTRDELHTANPALPPWPVDGNLTQGQVLQIPCYGNSSAHCGLCGQSYTVQPEDGGQAIQLKCRTKGLTAANPGVDLEALQVGQSLNMPCTPPPSCSRCSPEVEINDTKLSNMASTCGVPIELLAYANDIRNNSSLQLGGKLLVPCAVLPAATNTCSICGASFEVMDTESIAGLARACGVSASAIYDIPDNFLDPTIETVSYTDVLLPCDSAVGCGPCGVAYTAQNDTLASVAVSCLVYPSTLKLLNPPLMGYTQDRLNHLMTTLTMPCKNTLLGLEISSGGLALAPLQQRSLSSMLVRSLFSVVKSAAIVYILL